MLSMDSEILKFYYAGAISRESALMFASNPETMLRRL
jgi:hypothetical protein